MKRKIKKVITQLKTLTDLWANLRKLGKPPVSRENNGTRHPKTVTMEDEKVLKIKTNKQEPIIQTVEGVKRIVDENNTHTHKNTCTWWDAIMKKEDMINKTVKCR